MMESDIFEPFNRLIEIEICGVRRAVPENNTLLRCFQFLSMETVSRAELCWNGDCANCQVWLKDDAKEKLALSCRTKVTEGMKIMRMSEEINFSEK